jgi:arsenite-transporting ATPase
LGVRLAGSPRRVPLRNGSLYAANVKATAVIRKWLRVRRSALEDIAVRGTWLDRDDVSGLLRLSLPGIDELAGMLEIARFRRAGRYDLVVADTAPTGHTLRMLSMPDTLALIATVFDSMQSKHRVMMEMLRGARQPDAADALIAELDRDSRDLAELLTDPARVDVSWVTLPEMMATAETVDAVRALADAHVHVRTIIINRLTPPSRGRCAWCRARRAFEASATQDLISKLRDIARNRVQHRAEVITVTDRGAEPIGLRALSNIGAELEANHPPPRPSRRGRPRARGRIDSRQSTRECDVFNLAGARLVMFGGKGGVGKTTCAAAAAIAIAQRHPSLRLLLLSTDPAHSLADVLETTVSDTAGPVPRGPENLHVRELDAAAAFHRIREQYAGAIDALFDRLTHGSVFDLGHDRRIMHRLLDLAPPGIDELVAVLNVTQALGLGGERARYDFVVMDTAPTGHALRLLEMPHLVEDWTKALMRILLKYQPVFGLGELGAMLLRLSRQVQRLRALLRDRIATQFVVVTRPGVLPRAETMRLLGRLNRIGIHVPAILVDSVGKGSCTDCRRVAAIERREIAALRSGMHANGGQGRLVIAPAEMPPPSGFTALLRWRKQWVCSLQR